MSNTYSLDVNCIVYSTNELGHQLSEEVPGNLTVNKTSATKFEVIGSRDGSKIVSYPNLGNSSVVGHFLLASNEISIDNSPDTTALSAWLNGAETEEAEETVDTLSFLVVDENDNPLGSVHVQLTDKSSIIDLWAEDADGDIVGAPQPMRLQADSLGRQMPACVGLIGLTYEPEVSKRVAEAVTWVSEKTGGYVRIYDLEPGKRVMHTIAYKDGAQTVIPLYIWDEDGEPYVDQGLVQKPRDVSFETDNNADTDGYKRVIVARSGGLTHLIRFRKKA